jgi:anti-sigma regulatory factor (Ser/Thr protein kinase)
MVVYGAPLSFPNDSENAVRTALAMCDEMERFNREIGEPLGLAMGICRGRALAGNVGSLRRMEYTVIGPEVNLASRLCETAPAGRIWTGPRIHEELKDRFGFAFLGPHRFKGTERIDVYEVLGPGASGRGTRPGKRGDDMKDRSKKVDKKVDLTIPMVPEMELAASRTAEAVAEFMGLGEDQIEEIKMALIEACINAMEHSGSKDPRVFINFDIGDDQLTIQISDRGHGFDPELARKQVAQKRERKETRRGWGLAIMEELMDDVHIQSDENGTVITMIKQR